jgi:hypothetical protein
MNKVVGYEHKGLEVNIVSDKGLYNVDISTSHGTVTIVCATIEEALTKFHDVVDNESGSTN